MSYLASCRAGRENTMCTEDRRIISQIKGMNLNSARDLSHSVEESSDCNSCHTEREPALPCVCVCVFVYMLLIVAQSRTEQAKL